MSFPLGGIGTGTIGLGGRGELREWEIFNAPNLGYRPPYTMPFLFVRAGARRQAVVLERRLLPPYHASHGLPPAQLPGLPRLAEAVFTGTYPVARLRFIDKSLPVSVSLTAFNPMVPLDAEASAIPGAVLVYTVRNASASAVEGTLALSMANIVGMSCPEGAGENWNEFRRVGQQAHARTPRRPSVGQLAHPTYLSGLYMTSRKYPPDHPGYGTMALSTTADDVTFATDFQEAGWFDLGEKLWRDFSDDGLLSGMKDPSATAGRNGTVGMLGACFRLKPGAQAEIPFFITWSFPTRLADWNLPKETKPRTVRNHYAARFPDAWSAARHLAENFDALAARTLAFERALFDSALPEPVLDAVSSQMSIIRTNTALWLDSPPEEKGGRIFAFEGCSPKAGCCPMNCTHVWNYEQSLAHLYPALERTMRLTDYQDNLHDEGAMSFRSVLPLKLNLPAWNPKTPAADGQFGTVVKVHREWRISGDDGWLRRLWPAVKQSVEFAWRGFAGWDADKDGVMEGVQHNTYDVEFHGPNTMCGALYLAGLKAGVEMAHAVGDDSAAAEFAAVLESGSARQDKLLFNGEYYRQKVTDVPAEYVSLAGPTIKAGRPKYQYGHGCLADQLLGQWAAHVAGLGYVLPEKHVKKALASVFRYNFRRDLADHQSCQRVYALNDEGGVVLCTWPKGKREEFPFPYSDELWTGIEYQVAAHLIYEGLVEEGLAVVQAVRARHDGVRRNPWNEFECGDRYARALASWSVLLALSGQRYDGRSATLTVKPVWRANDFRCLFTAAEGYGSYAQRRAGQRMTVSVECIDGRVVLSALEVALPADRGRGGGVAGPIQTTLNGQAIASDLTRTDKSATLRLPQRLDLKAGDCLACRIG